jgi:nucleotide-binding universal stress UspA family protein
MLKHILVPLDGSALAEKALDYAVRIIAPKRRITLVCIVEIPDVASSFHPLPANLMMVEDSLASARDYLDRIASALRKDHQLRVNIEIQVGKPATVITEIAETEFVDAIVISTHGRTGVQRFIFGSVTQKILSSMPCPVFVVPGKETAKSAEEQPFGLTQQAPTSS